MRPLFVLLALALGACTDTPVVPTGSAVERFRSVPVYTPPQTIIVRPERSLCQQIPITWGEAAASPDLAAKVQHHNDMCSARRPKPHKKKSRHGK